MMKEAFELRGRVEAVSVAATPGSIVSTGVKKIVVVRGHGVKGDSHAGARLADVRERELLAFGLPKGVEIANHREFSAVSAEELAEIGAAMGLPTAAPRGCLGENLVVSGIPRFTELPTGSLLFFRKNEAQIRSAVLTVWGENMPCQHPGEALQERFPGIPKLAAAFPKAAIGKRGVVGSVYCSGTVHEGDEVVVKVPRQRIYGP
jgi:hypothetical protein